MTHDTSGRPGDTFALRIEGLHCASCVGRVERAVLALPGVVSAAVNLATGTATIEPASADRRAVAAAIVQAGFKPVGMERVLALTGLHCASCVGRVETALRAAPGVASASVNLATAQARVVLFDPDVDLVGVIARAGYGAAILDGHAPRPDRGAAMREEATGLARAVWIAAAFSLPIVIVEMLGHLVPAFHMAVMDRVGARPLAFGEFMLTTLVLFGPGRRFFTMGLTSLWRLAPDMNALVALGAGAAYLYSAAGTFVPGLGGGLYFEAAAVIVTLILLGRLLEARARGKTGAAIEKLIALQPTHAHRVEADGAVVEIVIDDVAVGDRLLVKPGERIPADGTLDEGKSFIDESMLTGEARPVAKTAGEPVTGGSVNGTGTFVFRVSGVGGETVLARIVAMVEAAQGSKLPVQALADRVTAWFVPAVMLVALLTFGIWLAVGATLGAALIKAVAVLIISCPCAMGLATPVSIMVATGRAAELGILFREGRALQALAGVTLVAFDKTGTLTMGTPSLVGCVVRPGFERADVLARAAALEARSEHPVARAILDAASTEGLAIPEASAFEARPGRGISGQVRGDTVLIGTLALLREAGIDVSDAPIQAGPDAPVYVAIAGRFAATLTIADAVKPDAAALIAALKMRHIASAMITGDTKSTAEAVARDLGIATIVAEVMPGDKVAALKGLPGGARAFVGDGINDAPVLAAADVGIAVGTGTDIAIEAADVVLMGKGLDAVTRAIALSQATMSNIRQNLFWAFAYNIVLIPVAAGALVAPLGVSLSPMLAAAAMALSSVFVVANALRLGRFDTRTGGGANEIGTKRPLPA